MMEPEHRPFRRRAVSKHPEVTMVQPKIAKFGLFTLFVLSIGVAIGRFLL
jgi:hypothetical protein